MLNAKAAASSTTFKSTTIDAAPMIQNDRTFVPFRALAEAFGAEVAYDEATQAVTAKLNGVEVVMTIGSATYTIVKAPLAAKSLSLAVAADTFASAGLSNTT